MDREGRGLALGEKPVLEWGTETGARLMGVYHRRKSGRHHSAGQKDHRGNNPEANWGIVSANGTYEKCTATKALKHYQASRSGAWVGRKPNHSKMGQKNLAHFCQRST
jgi:hypothetical protein